MKRLAMFLRIQMVAMLSFAVGWTFAPGFVNETFFDWDTGSFWPRVLGASYFALAWGAWTTAEHLKERMDLVWMFAAFPISYVVAMVWERVDGTYPGSELFFWLCGAITMALGLGVLVLRVLAGRQVADGANADRELVDSSV